MGLCKDPVTKELHERGYNLVKLPRVGIEPLDVLGRDGKTVEKLGSIAEVWNSSVAVPAIGAPAPAAGIDGQRTSDLDVGIGLKLLADALAGLGGGISLPSLGVAYKNARKVQFTFVDVESVSVTPFALGKYLAEGTLDLSNPFASRYFANDETQEYIIFDVLKSDTITVSAKGESGTTVAADVGALGGAAGLDLKVGVGSSAATGITFKGKTKATFAFKAFEVVFANGRWTPAAVPPAGGVDFAPAFDDVTEEIQPVVLEPGQLLRLR